MADYWMKLYIEILDDPKMATLPDRVWRRVIELFLCAKRIGKDGHLPDTRQLAWMIRMNPDELEADIAQIAHTGIVIREVGGWFIPKFKERQDAVPAKERKQQQRDREHSQQYYENVTDLSRNVTQSTESDNRVQRTETEAEQSGPAPFDLFQRKLEAWGVMVATAGDIKNINAMIEKGSTLDDLENAHTWVQDNNGGKAIYVGSLVKPVETERLKRIQKGNGHQGPKRVLRDAYDRPCDENGDLL